MPSKLKSADHKPNASYSRMNHAVRFWLIKQWSYYQFIAHVYQVYILNVKEVQIYVFWAYGFSCSAAIAQHKIIFIVTIFIKVEIEFSWYHCSQLNKTLINVYINLKLNILMIRYVSVNIF